MEYALIRAGIAVLSLFHVIDMNLIAETLMYHLTEKSSHSTCLHYRSLAPRALDANAIPTELQMVIGFPGLLAQSAQIFQLIYSSIRFK